MCADLLREAASKMRERAEFAPDAPWAAEVRDDGRAWVDVADEDDHAWSMHGFPAAAHHVASWHPAVALAVADWLEDEAERVDDNLATYRPERTRYDTTKGWVESNHRAALAVARAYLGSDR